MLVVGLGLLGPAAAPPARAQKMPSVPPIRGHGQGNLAYDFELKDLEGHVHRLREMRGKRVVQVVFWATWCVPCIEEIPALREIYAKYRGRGLEVLGVAVDMNQTREGVRDFARDYQVTYPILWDEGHAMTAQYGVYALPQNFLIGKDGIIHYAGSGLPRDYEVLLERLLGKDGAIPKGSAH